MEFRYNCAVLQEPFCSVRGLVLPLQFRIWARSKATKGDVGGSVSAYCREAGINLQTFNRQRRRACAAIAVDLNRQAEDVLATLVDLGGATPGLAGASDDAG